MKMFLMRSLKSQVLSSILIIFEQWKKGTYLIALWAMTIIIKWLFLHNILWRSSFCNKFDSFLSRVFTMANLNDLLNIWSAYHSYFMCLCHDTKSSSHTRLVLTFIVQYIAKILSTRQVSGRHDSERFNIS